MPTISPARNCSDTPASRTTPSASRHCRSCAASKLAPGVLAVPALAARPSCTRRPTMASASWSRLHWLIGPSNTTAPWRITVTASHSAMISLSLWVISSSVVPVSRSRRRVTNRCAVSCGVSTAVGSSRIRIFAPRNSAFRISSRWRSPTGRSSTALSRRTCRPVSAIRASSWPRTWARALPRRQCGSAPSMMLSSALSGSTSMKCWCTMPMPSAMASADPLIRAGWPWMRMVPLSAW